MRVDDTKTAAGRRTIPLPAFAITMLTERRKRPFTGEQTVIFPSTNGADNFAGQWRAARDELGVTDVTSQLPQDGSDAH